MKIHPRDVGLANPRMIGKKPKGRRKATTPEDTIQSLVEQYLNRQGIPFIRIPAYVLRAAFGWRPGVSGAELGAMREASGYLKGLPDVIAMDDRGRALPIELKTDAKASKLSAAQRMWRAAIGTKEARSFEEAKRLIDEWRAA